MTLTLLLVGIVLIACMLCQKISNKFGTPMLLAFILLGMLFGSDGLLKIPFEDYQFAEQICSIALIFIMFYGGFGTKWKLAKPVAAQAIVLSSFGTILTACFVGLFCHFVLRIALLESFLIGSVISSTDAASVFSILRSKRLNLRYQTASLLEVESGSNDPFSYMLTVIFLALMNGQATPGTFVVLLLQQVIFGLIFGFGIAGLTVLFLKKFRISSSGFSSIFFVAIALLAYAAPSLLGGNGYLSVYIAGIILGNSHLDRKQELVHFFDGITGLMQMVLFFLLGLLAFPSKLPEVALIAFLIAMFLTFVARPLAVLALMSPFRSKWKQQALVSWAGMRGAASIVFAIMIVIHPVTPKNDVFHIIFFIVLFSILLQGTLLPWVAKWLKMTDPNADVMKTFTDYAEEDPVRFLQFSVPKLHGWVGKRIYEILLPPDLLFVLIIRGNKKIIPTGNTKLCAEDVLILGGLSFDQAAEDFLTQGHLVEKEIDAQHEWVNKPIHELKLQQDLIVLIKRNRGVVIPKGNTVILENDILVIADKGNLEEK